MTHVRTVVLAALVFTACDAAPSEVSTLTPQFSPVTTTKTNEMVPVSGTTVNSCNGETIEVSGRFHLMTTMTTDGTTATYSLKLNTAGVEGVGLTTGAKYNFIATQHVFSVGSSEPPYAYSQDIKARIKTVSQGKIDNNTITQVVRLSFDGTTTTSEFEQTNTCNG